MLRQHISYCDPPLLNSVSALVEELRFLDHASNVGSWLARRTKLVSNWAITLFLELKFCIAITSCSLLINVFVVSCVGQNRNKIRLDYPSVSITVYPKL